MAADWSGRPAYAQVADQLREQIRSGHYAPGSQLPSYEALMKAYGVSITVIRSAIRELKTEGLVYTHQGKGAFVRDPLPPPGQAPAGQGSDAFQAVMAEIRSLHDDLGRMDERLARVERVVLPDDA
jgi:DNA-binding GntR family transcriptional regulator